MNVVKIETKYTAKGDDYKSVTLDEKVFGNDRFNIFRFHSRYADVEEGRAFAAEEFEQDGKYIKLKDPVAKQPKQGTRAGFNVAVAQENKAKHIAEAQDNRDYGIKVSSTARDATLIAVAMLEAKAIEPTQFKAQWAIIRSWLWENWEQEKPQDPTY